MVRKIKAMPIVVPDEDAYGSFTGKETQELILAFMQAHDRPVTEEELEKCMAFAHETKIRMAMMEGILDGIITVSGYDGDDLKFSARLSSKSVN